MSTTLPEPETVASDTASGGATSGRIETFDGAAPRARRGTGRVRTLLGRLGLALLAVAGVGVLVWFAWTSIFGTDLGADTIVLHTVSRGDLPIVVTARGNLESQTQTDIRCEVESVAYDRSSGQSGAQIIQIVPNGHSVSKDDLLVEFDTAALKEMIDTQVVAYEKAHADTIQAVVKYENQITQNETLMAEAQLAVDLAELGLEMYDDEGDGTFRIELGELDLSIQEAMNKIVEAKASLLLAETERDGIETLYKLGYRGRGDFDQAVFAHIRAEDELVRATNALSNLRSSRKKLQHYEYPMRKLELEGAVKTAKRALIQTGRDNESLLAQAEAAKNAAERSEAKEKEKLDRYNAQLERCKIYAPHDGMVVYATERRRGGSSSVIAEGAYVRERQSLLKLPDLSSMQVKTGVHESVLDQVRAGLPCTIRVDAFPERVYRGTVRSVAVLPDEGNWLASDTKFYETVVTIDESVDQLKPGMTAVVEVHVVRLDDVLSVPVQAIVQRGRDTWCFTQGPGGVERMPVELGRTNDQYVEIRSGLESGDQVVLNPMSILDDATDFAAEKEEVPPFDNDLAPDEQIAGAGENADSDAPPSSVQQVANQDDRPAAGQGARQGPPGGQRGGERFGGREITPEMRQRFEAMRAERRAGGGNSAGGDVTGERRGRRAGGGEGGRRRRAEENAAQPTEAVEAGGGG